MKNKRKLANFLTKKLKLSAIKEEFIVDFLREFEREVKIKKFEEGKKEA